MIKRCEWAGNDPLSRTYHDEEWGVPVFDDRRLFEFLILEGAQAGLSWITILRKRENYRKAFDQFDAHKIARYKQSKIDQLLDNPGIVRNRLKINAAIKNARSFLDIQKKYGSFREYVWQFSGGKPMVLSWSASVKIPPMPNKITGPKLSSCLLPIRIS